MLIGTCCLVAVRLVPLHSKVLQRAVMQLLVATFFDSFAADNFLNLLYGRSGTHNY